MLVTKDKVSTLNSFQYFFSLEPLVALDFCALYFDQEHRVQGGKPDGGRGRVKTGLDGLCCAFGPAGAGQVWLGVGVGRTR